MCGNRPFETHPQNPVPPISPAPKGSHVHIWGTAVPQCGLALKKLKALTLFSGFSCHRMCSYSNNTHQILSFESLCAKGYSSWISLFVVRLGMCALALFKWSSLRAWEPVKPNGHSICLRPKWICILHLVCPCTMCMWKYVSLWRKRLFVKTHPLSALKIIKIHIL